MMFQAYPFYDRFEAVKRCGIQTVEFWKWSNKDAAKIAEILQEKQMKISVFNIDSKNEELSYRLSRGILNEGDTSAFLYALEESIPVYKQLQAEAMIVLLGEKQEYHPERIYDCLKAAAPILQQEQVKLVVEPLNSFDRKEYVMPYAEPVLKILKQLDSPQIRLLYDMYHQGKMGDFSLDMIRENLDYIGHFHVADVPGRHEPGTGRMQYQQILQQIEQWDYDKYVGLEYQATKPDEETLDFLKGYLHD